MSNARDLPAAPSAARILFVDDDAFMRRALNTALSNRGFATRLADSAAAALDILRTEPVDVVVTDQQMPGLSGLDLMQKMRNEGFDTPVILLTGFGSVDLAVTAVRAGAVHFLTKPVDPVELHQLITDILQTPLKSREAPRQAAAPHASIRPAVPAVLAVPAVSEPPAEWLATLPPGSEVLVLSSLDVADGERLLIQRAMERTRGDVTHAATLLGIHPRTLHRKLREIQITLGDAATLDD